MEELRGIIINGINIQEEVVNSIVIMFALLGVMMYASSKIKATSPEDEPKGIVLLAEIFVTSMNNFSIGTVGKNYAKKFAPYFGTLVLFLAVANLVGLIGMKPPTSNYNVTLALALITAFFINFLSFKHNGFVGYFKEWFQPLAVMLPLNIIDVVVTPISLSLRLFGNILSGSLIMGVVYYMLGWIAIIASPVLAILHGYFDIFAGLIQTYIFLMLSAIFISGSIPEEELKNK